MGEFIDPAIALEAGQGTPDEAHELAHFVQLVSNTSGMLYLWGWAIVLKGARMLRSEMRATGFSAFRLPLTSIDGEQLSPRAGAILENLLVYLETIERYEAPSRCATRWHQRKGRARDVCPWADIGGGEGVSAPIGAYGLREALARLIAFKVEKRGPKTIDAAIQRAGRLSPAYPALALLAERVDPRLPLDAAVALMDLALMAPPDPGHAGTSFAELHPGRRFLRMLPLAASHGVPDFWDRRSYCAFADGLVRRLGWRSWRRNLRDVLRRVAPQLGAPRRLRESGIGSERRYLLAAVATAGARWRTASPGALCRNPEEWLPWARGLVPLVARSGLWASFPPAGVERGAVERHFADASLFRQMLFSRSVHCLYALTGRRERCPSFVDEARCPVFPNPPKDAVECSFSDLWVGDLGLPAGFDVGRRDSACLRCFGQPHVPAALRRRYVRHLGPELPKNHLAAAYGGTGFFNPCLALIWTPEGDDPISRVDESHELAHAIMSRVSLGRAMFLARFFSLLLWHAWAWELLSADVPFMRSLDRRLDSLVRSLVRTWLPAQEGVAWRETFAALTALVQKGEVPKEAVSRRLRVMNDVVTLGPEKHPLVRGWFWGMRLDERHGVGTYRAVTSSFCDPLLPVPRESLADWIEQVGELASHVIHGIPRLVRAHYRPLPRLERWEAAETFRARLLGRKLYPPVDTRAEHWRDVVLGLAACEELPAGFIPAVQRVVDAVAGTSRYFTRFGFNVMEASPGTTKRPGRVSIGRPSAPTDELVERQINRLAALDFYRGRKRWQPTKVREAIRASVPADETFAELVSELIFLPRRPAG
jgi:hypothetical protein